MSGGSSCRPSNSRNVTVDAARSLDCTDQSAGSDRPFHVRKDAWVSMRRCLHDEPKRARARAREQIAVGETEGQGVGRAVREAAYGEASGVDRETRVHVWSARLRNATSSPKLARMASHVPSRESGASTATPAVLLPVRCGSTFAHRCAWLRGQTSGAALAWCATFCLRSAALRGVRWARVRAGRRSVRSSRRFRPSHGVGHRVLNAHRMPS